MILSPRVIPWLLIPETPPARRAIRAVLLSLLATATACGQASASSQQNSGRGTPAAASATPPVVVADTLASPEEGDADQGEPTISGTLAPRERAVLRAELSGPVQILSVRVGDRVTKGAVLARLDAPAVRVTLAAADAQVAAQEAQRLQVTRERDRVARLLAAGGASRAEFEELEARVNAAEAAVTAARAQLAAATADNDRTTIRAPFTGVVERRSVTPGSVVQAGDELLTIVDPHALELEGALAIAYAARVRTGARVALRVTGWGDTLFTGRIVRVAPAVDPVTRQWRVTVALPNAGARVPVGAWAEGTLLTDSLARRPHLAAQRTADTTGGH